MNRGNRPSAAPKDEAWIAKALDEIGLRSNLTLVADLKKIQLLEEGALILPVICGANRKLVLKIGISEGQRYWMGEISAICSHVVPQVLGSGATLLDQRLNWLLMEEVETDLISLAPAVQGQLEMILAAAVEFHRAAQFVPPKFIATISTSDIARWLVQAKHLGAPPNDVDRLLDTLEADFSFISETCDFEVCHGDLQPANTGWKEGTVDIDSILFDCEPIVQPWPLEAVALGVKSGKMGAVQATDVMNRFRRAKGYSSCPEEAINDVEAIALGWSAARLWRVILYEIQRDPDTRNYIEGKLTHCIRHAASRKVRKCANLGEDSRYANVQQKFCHKPFTFFETDAANEGRVCCADWLHTSLGKLTATNLSTVWNSQQAQEIRASILDGSFKYCDKLTCPDLVKGTLPTNTESRRIPYFRRLIDEQITELPRGPITINFGHDNSCNLKCPTCRPHLIFLTGHRRSEALEVQTRIESEFLSQSRELIITGHGDALASPIYRQFLENFDARKYTDVKIILMTNGLLFTPAVWGRIASAHDAIGGVSVSVDAATPHTYAINRGADFEKLLSNLRFIADLVEDGRLWAELSFVVQANNYEEMPGFVELAKSLKFSSVLFQRLVHWGETFSEAEFKSRAIHLPTHPQHMALLATLSNSTLKDPIVDLSNLQDLQAVS
jgi:pyruvate-formate lyase-activating enzyme